jgi:hypothetical protein
MPDKKHKKQILNSIASVAKQLGRAPSHAEFFARAGNSRYAVSRFFRKWNDAVRAAGLKPRKPGRQLQVQDNELLRDWGETVRRKRAVPSRRAYLLEGKYDPRTLEKRFGGWSALPHAFRKFAKGKRKWADVVALLPALRPQGPRERPGNNLAHANLPHKNHSLALTINPQGCRPALRLLPRKVHHAALKDRTTYGNPMDFRGLRHEPVNEQGVVFLFGMLAKELGYMVEAMQGRFPDCEAKRQIAPERWQRVHIEFEFESRNFRDHGHPASGCDVIVCWRHNWHDCPKHLEVVELSSVIKSPANSGD